MTEAELESLTNEFNSIQPLLTTGQWPVAEMRLKSLIERYPDFLPAYEPLTGVLMQQRKFDETLQVAQAGLAAVKRQQQQQLDPTLIERPLRSMTMAEAIGLSYRGEHETAINTLRRLRQENPDTASTVELGGALYRAGDFDAAEELFTEAALSSDDPNATACFYNNVAMLYELQGEMDGALKFFERAAETLPRDENTLREYGVALADRGQTKRAISVFEQAVRCNPHSERARQHLDEAYYMLKVQTELEDKRLALEARVRREAASAEDWLEVADFYRSVGRSIDAMSAFERAVAFDQHLVRAHVGLISTYSAKEMFDKTAQAFNAALDSNPKVPILRAMHAVWLEKTQNDLEAAYAELDLAEALLMEMPKSDDLIENVDAIILLADVRAAHDEWMVAVAHYVLAAVVLREIHGLTRESPIHDDSFLEYASIIAATYEEFPEDDEIRRRLIEVLSTISLEGSLLPDQIFENPAQACARLGMEEATIPAFKLLEMLADDSGDDEDQFEEAPVERAQAKVGRNKPCPCGSGRKFKKCCGS